MSDKIELTTVIQRKANIAFTDIDHEIMLLHPELGRFFSFNKIGSTIWNLIQNPITVNELVKQLTSHFEVDADTCFSDVSSFLALLLEKKLIEIIA